MKPVFQQIVDPDTGDCFSAALASLLELDINDVPKFRRDFPAPENYMIAARRWLEDNYGLSLITIQMEDLDNEVHRSKDIRLIGATSGTPCLAGGRSANVPGILHCVVGEITASMNFRMTHDPNPNGKGILGRPLHLYFLLPVRPEVFVSGS